MKLLLLVLSFSLAVFSLPTPHERTKDELVDAEKRLAVVKRQHTSDECQTYKYEQNSRKAPLGYVGRSKLATAQKADLHDHKLLNEAEAEVESLGGPRAPPKHSLTVPSTSLGQRATITSTKCPDYPNY